MNKTTITVAALGLLTAAAPALAQSSVTLFGVVDLAARQVKNDDSQSRLDGSGLTSSRLGIRGTEDLGGGLRAHFWLEGAVDPDTGGGGTWQRRSTVGLQGGFGEIRMGREKNPNGLSWEQLDPFGDTGMGAVGRMNQSNGLLPAGGVNNSYSRTSNQVSYYTPGSSGFFGHAALAAGEGALGNKHIGARIGYRSSELLLLASYGTTEVTTGTDAKRLTLGGTYDLKSVKFFGMYATTDVGAADQTNLLLGLTAPVAGMDLKASFHKMDGGGSISSRSATQLSLGLSKALSRRTAIYGNFARISNDATNFTVATGSALTAGNDSSGYEIGVRHSF